ncbi:hypothetical protein THIOM_002304 [Candidatus Thiomargarita nelsonii]|uniref:Uncharacterized protein n=1 Tax=Candidatus Thiomargarita nelsonii TaxID=1003181 RepID=A0A176S1U7_9GAMM|nr:hypothetical protein THIOM_002304 [Candidatus Thiomargarita nelsonii]
MDDKPAAIKKTVKLLSLWCQYHPALAINAPCPTSPNMLPNMRIKVMVNRRVGSISP